MLLPMSEGGLDFRMDAQVNHSVRIDAGQPVQKRNSLKLCPLFSKAERGGTKLHFLALSSKSNVFLNTPTSLPAKQWFGWSGPCGRTRHGNPSQQ